MLTQTNRRAVIDASRYLELNRLSFTLGTFTMANTTNFLRDFTAPLKIWAKGSLPDVTKMVLQQ